MTDWTYTLSDGATGTVPADDLTAASLAALAKATNGRTVMLVQRVETPTPTVVTSASGADLVLDLDEGGTLIAAPVEE